MKNMAMKYKIILIFVVIAGVLVVGDFFIQKNAVKETIDPFDTVEVGTSQEQMSEEELELYGQKLNDGVVLIREGDNGNFGAYENAILNYKQAAEISNYNSWIPYHHLGIVYRRMKEYDKADQAFTNALKISNNTELTVFLSRIEMYRYELHKSNEEIKQVYEEAIKSSSDASNAEVSYAGFLKDIGDNEEAVKYYKILIEKYPGNQTYQQEIDELSAK
jgi:tetratricopeptide (TPR) repeat protein